MKLFLPIPRKKAASIIFNCIFIFTFSKNSIAQTEEGGAYPLEKNDANHPCVTPQQYAVMEKQIKDNCKMLGLPTENQSPQMTTTFSWPLRTAVGFNDCSYYGIFNYLDQDATAGIKDWNCGTATYDGHRGNDIAIFPYPFFKMDNNQVEVIAAAPGTIVNKVDGNFDKNCAANNLNPNYIAIQHADGSVAIYLHMKMNSLTAKIVGQTVIAGEFLGDVGSSGSSTSPHLHFEVWANANANSLQDAFAGPCNSLNATTWWAVQKPYTEPAIVCAQVNSIAPVFPTCPTTETPNDTNCFASAATGKFYIFIRNETVGLVANMRIVNPNGSTFSSWVHNSNTNYLAAYWFSNRPLPATTGTYTFEAVYNGDTCRKIFNVNCNPLGVPTISFPNEISVAPNPTNNSFQVVGNAMQNGNYKFTLTNVVGEIIFSENSKVENGDLQKNISLAEFPDGIYFLSIETENMKVVKKIIKEK